MQSKNTNSISRLIFDSAVKSTSATLNIKIRKTDFDKSTGFNISRSPNKEVV